MNSTSQQLINCLTYYKDSELVRAVLKADSSFCREAGRFYDVDVKVSYYQTSPGIPCIEYEFREKDKNKKQEKPSTLIEILAPFSQETIEETKLAYEDVREDHRKWVEFNDEGFNQFMVGLVDLGVALYGGIEIHPAFGAFAGLVGLSMCVHGCRKQKNSNGEFEEFQKLCKAAAEADDFFVHAYRLHILREKLGEK